MFLPQTNDTISGRCCDLMVSALDFRLHSAEAVLSSKYKEMTLTNTKPRKKWMLRSWKWRTSLSSLLSFDSEERQKSSVVNGLQNFTFIQTRSLPIYFYRKEVGINFDNLVYPMSTVSELCIKWHMKDLQGVLVCQMSNGQNRSSSQN